MAHQSIASLRHATIYSVFSRNHGAPVAGRSAFNRVRLDLPRIRSLGSDIVWLMPIHPIGEQGRKGGLGSPYAILDYRGVHAELGTPGELRALVDAAHEQGLRLIIDVVFNHTSPDSVLAREHRDWFITDAAGRPTPKFPEWWDIVDLRYREPDGSPNRPLWDYLIATLSYWVGQGVDGFRCDVASLVPLEFWLEARSRLEEGAGRTLIWLAETVHPHFAASMRNQGYGCLSDGEILQAFDLSYDYDGCEVLDRYFSGLAPLQDYLNLVRLQPTLVPAHGHKLRFLENHDQARAADKIRGESRLRSWTAFHALLPGAFLVYAGQEYQAQHRPDLFDHDPIAIEGPDTPWTTWFRALLALAAEIKRTCRFVAADQVAAGLVLVHWAPVRDAGPGGESAQPGGWTAILNLEDRFGSFSPGTALAGRDAFTGAALSLPASGAAIPKEPLLIRHESPPPLVQHQGSG